MRSLDRAPLAFLGSEMPNPFFSVVITTYNRARIVRRCLDSCLAQTFTDFEVIVVDDGSSDDTVAVLEEYSDPRLRVIAHEHNRGINPARFTGASAARGEWVVVVDSDDELLEGALEGLRERIATLPQGVQVLRSSQLHDDDQITPAFVPDGPYGYEGRIRWAEAEGGQDAARCLHRSVFASSPYIDGHRGAMETLFELNLAENETSVCVEDVFTRVHSDAPDSWLRNGASASLIPRLRREAPDMLWMAETTLARHGAALERYGPGQMVTVLRIASTQAFLLGQRRKGAAYGLRALRRRPLDAPAWITLFLGLLGPWAVERGAVAYRRARRA
jgi:glycosyltransferase involved in cell wall biosynthesis